MKIQIKYVIVLLSLSMLIITNCKKDNDDDNDAVDLRSNFTGTYLGTLSWTDSVVFYSDFSFSVAKSSVDYNGLFFYNFGDYGELAIVKAFIDGSNFTIPHQIIYDQNGYEYGIIGSGFLSGDDMFFTFQESDKGYLFNIAVIAEKI